MARTATTRNTLGRKAGISVDKLFANMPVLCHVARFRRGGHDGCADHSEEGTGIWNWSGHVGLLRIRRYFSSSAVDAGYCWEKQTEGREGAECAVAVRNGHFVDLCRDDEFFIGIVCSSCLCAGCFVYWGDELLVSV